MTAETDAQARLLAYYDQTADELEAHSKHVRDELEGIEDPQTRQRAQGQITRLLGLARANRYKACRVRASPAGKA